MHVPTYFVHVPTYFITVSLNSIKKSSSHDMGAIWLNNKCNFARVTYRYTRMWNMTRLACIQSRTGKFTPSSTTRLSLARLKMMKSSPILCLTRSFSNFMGMKYDQLFLKLEFESNYWKMNAILIRNNIKTEITAESLSWTIVQLLCCQVSDFVCFLLLIWVMLSFELMNWLIRTGYLFNQNCWAM